MKESTCPECKKKMKPQFFAENTPIDGKIYKYVIVQCPECGHIFHISQVSDISLHNITQEVNRIVQRLDLISQHFQDTTGQG